MKRKVALLSTLTLAVIASIQPAQAADTLKSYTMSLYELDDSNARKKKIRLIYSLENVWNQSSVPQQNKEARLLLKGGSGFDMTHVPNKTQTWGYSTGADFRYTVPTAFKLALSYASGSSLRHINHAPENTISSASVSESLDYNLGVTGSSSPSISAGVSWSNRVTYDQPEFQTVADFDQSNESVTWMIENKTIRGHSPAKDWLLYRWTNCDNNLIDYNELPVVMRSDFKPQVGVVYSKRNINDGQKTTDIKLTAAWRKTDYYFGKDWCSYHTNFTWKKQSDLHNWMEAERTITIAWNDSLYN